MSGKVINLRMARKRIRRADHEAQAEINRFEHGRTRTERDLARTREQQASQKHEQGRRENPVGTNRPEDG